MNAKEKEEKVYKVFQTISDDYDAANTRISLGMEKSWKRKLIELFADCSTEMSKLLDVCCGTGDISIALKKQCPKADVTGLDFSPAMLDVAKAKVSESVATVSGSEFLNEIKWIQGNAMALPFEDNSFDGVCISFGLRNTPDYKQVLSEMKRVLKPGGILACIDSFVPDNGFIRFFYNIYFKGIMPHIGGKKEHKAEYDWLANSTEEFLRAPQLETLFKELELKEVKVKRMMCGACCLHYGIKK